MTTRPPTRSALLALAKPDLAKPDLAKPALAGPAERAAPAARFAETSILTQRGAEEAVARQAEFDRRLAERSNRAARSICSGCVAAGDAGRRSATFTPRAA